ncbi:MAG: hypothetical protein ACOX18_00020 [Bacillota bacterium]|jgi:hypothetical protein
MIEHIAEVVESATSEFLAECRELHVIPPFGSLVKVSGPVTAYGLVYEAATRSIEPNRRATAFGLSAEELALEQPQIFELLRSEIKVLLVGYEQDGAMWQILPPEPPRIHAFVYPCSTEEISRFTAEPDWLRCLLNSARGPVDELIIAAVRQAAAAQDEPKPYLVQTGKELARLLRDDYDRLGSLIRRMAR